MAKKRPAGPRLSNSLSTVVKSAVAVVRLVRRKGAVRRSDIPPAVLQKLNSGEIATANLVEWLAIDMVSLAETVFHERGQADAFHGIRSKFDELMTLGILERSRQVALALWNAMPSASERLSLRQHCSQHVSDVVRIWAAQMPAGSASETLSKALKRIEPFAADEHFGVREIAWMEFRPFVARSLAESLTALRRWAASDDERLRRFAIEVIRPKGVWCAHLAELKHAPMLALPLLDMVKADPARYVQLSVANWLNDASYTQPEWVKRVCADWIASSPTESTRWIAHHAQRTLRKK